MDGRGADSDVATVDERVAVDAAKILADALRVASMRNEAAMNDHAVGVARALERVADAISDLAKAVRETRPST